MKTQRDKVLEFHEIYGMPILSSSGRKALGVPNDRIPLRLSLIVEELDELFTATMGIDKGVIEDIVEFVTEYRDTTPVVDIVETADALGDLIYVINGMSIELGIPLDHVFDEIHSSNMSKLDEDGNPIYREDGKVLKGPNFREPDIAMILESN